MSPDFLIVRSLEVVWLVTLLWLSYKDVRERILPNQAVLLLIALALAFGLLSDGLNFLTDTEHLFNSFLVGLGAVLLYALKVWGAGDAKMVFALALGFPGQLVDFLLLTAIFGGLLSICIGIASIIGKKLHMPTITTVPYGVALSLSAAVIRFCL